MQKQKTPWLGQVHFEAGIGIFLGDSGDNGFHSHWAHQIVVGLEADVTVRSAAGSFTSRAIWIEAGTEHCLQKAKLLSIYVDPLHAISTKLKATKQEQGAPMSAVDEGTSRTWLAVLQEGPDLKTFVEHLKLSYWSEKPSGGNRLDQVLQLIQSDIESGNDSSRAQLACVASLSPSRFSHWFSEQMGIPLRSYKKWLRMVRGIDLATRMSLTEAALQSGFSDQAHFCRTVMNALGVNPVDVKRILTQSST